MSFALPESYAAYVAEPAVKTAVDHILGSKSLKIPEDLDWGQIRDFHAAVLAAHQVRCDYASALQDLWDEVWGNAIDEAGIGKDLEAWSITDTAYYYNGVGFDADSLFEERVFARGYTRGDSNLCLGVSLKDGEAQLCFWFTDENDEDRAAGLLSQDDWNVDLGDDYGYWSNNRLAPIRDGKVPLERLNAAAVRVLSAIPG